MNGIRTLNNVSIKLLDKKYWQTGKYYQIRSIRSKPYIYGMRKE